MEDEQYVLSGACWPVDGVCRLRPDEQTKETIMGLRIVRSASEQKNAERKLRLRELRQRKAKERLTYRMEIDTSKLKLKVA
jgi:hypothetical protein